MIILYIVVAAIIGVFGFLYTPKFGKHPKGERLARVEQSPNYRDGKFHNLEETPMFSDGVGYREVLYKFLFSSGAKVPKSRIPSEKTNLHELPIDEDVLVWMGHSSYYIQVDGKKILVDPVLSGNASPLFFTTRAYEGTDVYTPDDIPEIDYLCISHDHWDHLDYKAIVKLRLKVKNVICGLGTGAHLEYWGYDPSLIIEEDWHTTVHLDEGWTMHITPARHFSGRGFKRAQTLWASFALETPSYKLFLGGDSGYGDHFKTIGAEHGPFDLAIIENGQYDDMWRYLHMMPGEHLRAATDLGAKVVFPVHSAKFTLANHDWHQPLADVTSRADSFGGDVITPRIGAKVLLSDMTQHTDRWWEELV